MEWLKLVVDYGVIWLLILLSVVAVGCAIERCLVFKKKKTLIEVSGGVMFGMPGSLPVSAIIRKLQANRVYCRACRQYCNSGG